VVYINFLCIEPRALPACPGELASFKADTKGRIVLPLSRIDLEGGNKSLRNVCNFYQLGVMLYLEEYVELLPPL
jgi:hypothetical protein